MEEGEDYKIKLVETPESLTGLLFLANYDDDLHYVLVVKGEQRGKVWFMGYHLDPELKRNTYTQIGFLDWYEGWLDQSLAQLDPLHYSLPLLKTAILNYAGKGLKEFPKTSVDNNAVKRLVLSGNNFSELPKEVFQFEKLRILDLSRIGVINIPEDISVLKDLKKFRIRLYKSSNVA